MQWTNTRDGQTQAVDISLTTSNTQSINSFYLIKITLQSDSNTTSLGYITWSEDAQTVSYQDTSFTMNSLRSFVAAQVCKAQKELESLLLLHTDEKREDVVPTFFLHRLYDNPSNSRKG